MTDGAGQPDAGPEPSAFRGFLYPEASALFNPALGAAILGVAAAGHFEDTDQGLPWLASFLVMPFVLHPPTRDSLPRDTRTSMSAWVSAHPLLRDGFGQRVGILAPRTRDALRFALRGGIVSLESSRLVPAARIRRPASKAGEELRACINTARLCGRWFAVTDLITAYQLLGVRA